jgi:hypothetical protein
VKFASRSLVPTCPPFSYPERSSSCFLLPLPAAAGLCFHNLTNCFSRLSAGVLARKPFVLITIRIAPGVYLCGLCAPTSVPSVLRFLRDLYGLCFQRFAASLALLALFFGLAPFVFSNFQSLFGKYRGWGYPRLLRKPPRPLRLFTQSLEGCVILLDFSDLPLTPPTFRLSTVDCRLPSHNAKIHSNSL